MQETKKQQWYDKTITWLLYSLGVGVPLVFSTLFYSNFAEPKLLFFRVVTLLILLLWAWKSFVEEKIAYRCGKFSWFLLAYGIVLILSTLTSSNIFSSLLGAETRFLGIFTQLNFLVIAWLAYNFLTTKKELKTFITVTAITGIIILMIYGFLQYFGAFQNSFAWSQNPQERVFGTFGHSDNFGAYLGMCIMLSFGVIALTKNKLIKRLLAFCAVLAFVVLLLTGSRAALVATLISLLVVVVVLAIRNKNLQTFLKKYWWSFLLLLAIIGGSVFIFRESLSKIPVIQRFEQGELSTQQGFPPDRISWWSSSLEMFKDRPVLGFGLSTFSDIYNKYRHLDYRVPGPGNLQNQITPESSHDDYIDIALGAGALGLIAYLAILVFVFWSIDHKLFRKQKPDELFYITLGIKGALMVYLLQAIVNFGVVDTLTIFFLLLGAGMSAGADAREAKKPFFFLRPILKEITLCVFLIILIWGAFSTLHEARAEYSYKNAIIEQSLGRPDNARTWYQEMVNEEPYRYEYYEAFGNFAFQTATLSNVDPSYNEQYFLLALQNYQRASQINNFHPSTFYNMGITSIQLAQSQHSDVYIQQGINNLKQAITLSPNNPLYAYESAKIFQEVGQNDLAIQTLNKVVAIDPKFMDAQTLLQNLTKPI